MSVISEEDNKEKNELDFQIKLKKSSDDSNDSKNDEEIVFSSSSLLLRSHLITKTNPKKPSRKNMFDSIDIDIKKKLFSSENVLKQEQKISSEAISTEPTTSVKIKNYKSPKKRFSVIKMIEKGKKNKKRDIDHLLIKKEEEEKELCINKKERTDIYGNIISKKNKKNVKISFIDKVTMQPLVTVTDIECYKQYNCINGIPKEDNVDKKSNCQCCLIY